MRPTQRLATALMLSMGFAAPVAAAQCGNNAGGFDAWKPAFAKEAAAAGVGQRGLDALANARYASSTIAADRNQKSFNYSLDKFMQVRGADTIVAQGRKRKSRGELGHTQFLPGNALRYGVDGNGDGRVDFYNQTDALASTANFLRQKGWQTGAGYQEGQTNFNVIKQWNAAGVYQKAIAIMAARIDG